MTKKFKANNMEKLDNPLRRKMLPPYEVIKGLNIKEGQYIADLGCGIGYFSIPFAKTVGENGKVYAIDINSMMLEETSRRAKEEKLTNIETVLSSENNSKIKNSSVDVVFTATVFHEVDSPKEFLEECKRILKKGGSLIILDWNKVEEEFGPPIHNRIDVEVVKNFISEVGLKTIDVQYIGESFYIVKCE